LDLIPRPDLAVSDLLKERLIVRSDFDRTRFSATHGPSSLLKEDLTSSIAAALEFRALLMARDTRRENRHDRFAGQIAVDPRDCRGKETQGHPQGPSHSLRSRAA